MCAEPLFFCNKKFHVDFTTSKIKNGFLDNNEIQYSYEVPWRLRVNCFDNIIQLFIMSTMEVFAMQKIPQEHIEALIESEKQEAMGNVEYVTHEELKNSIERIFADFDEAKAV